MVTSTGGDVPSGSHARDSTASGNSSSRHGRKARKGKRENSGPTVPPDEGKPLASFIVEFLAANEESREDAYLTKVHHLEGDETVSWKGIEADRASRWMLERLHGVGGSAAEQDSEGQPDAEVFEAPTPESVFGSVEVNRVQVFQPPMEKPILEIDKGEAGAPISIQSDQPIGLSASLVLEGPGAVEAAKRKASYTARFLAQDLSTLRTVELGEPIRGTVLAEGVLHEARLEAPSPPAGVYRLKVVAVVEGARMRPGYLEVPWLQVL